MNALWPNLDSASDVALTQAYEQAGIKTKAIILPAGLSPSLIKSPAWPALQGVIFLDEVHPFQLPNAGTKAMQAALEKYDGYTSKDFPNFSESNAWLGADLMIKGIGNAGSNPTRASVVKALRDIKSYNGNGLLANTINFSTVFGHDLPICVWALRAEKTRLCADQKHAVLRHGHPGDEGKFVVARTKARITTCASVPQQVRIEDCSIRG